MKFLKPHSRLIPSVLLALLMVSILLVFLAFHNTLIGTGTQASETNAVLFTILTVVIAVTLFLVTARAINRNQQLSNEVSTLKRSLKAAQHQEQKVEVKEEVTIDAQGEADELLPQVDTSNRELFLEKVLSTIAQKHNIVQGLIYLKDKETGVYSYSAGYAFYTETAPPTYTEGETLSGQVAKNQQLLNVSELPNSYITILSGLGKGAPKHLLIVPLISNDGETCGVMELASFVPVASEYEPMFSIIGRKLGATIANINNTIEA